MDTRVANPCSLNLVPPTKKQRPRTCTGGSGCMSQSNRSMRNEKEKLTSTVDKGWFNE